MGLIDADALIKRWNEMSVRGRTEFDQEIMVAPSVISNAKEGEWIEQEDDYHHYWECSECGMGVGLDDIRNYCPNCGAKMRGTDDE